MAYTAGTITVKVDASQFNACLDEAIQRIEAAQYQPKQQAVGIGAALAGALVLSGSVRKRVSRRKFFSFGLLR